MARGIVYCLTNPAMPELVKIGLVKSVKADALKARISALYSTGVPLPFELYYAVAVDKPKEKEDLLHRAFNDFRENPKKEFFRVAPERVVAAMELTGGEAVSVDDTPDAGIDQADIDARERSRKLQNRRLSNFKFSAVDIEKGKEITFVRDHTITAEVLDDKKIKFEGEEYSLSGAAKVILERSGLYGSVAGPNFWQYDDETLTERRKRMEADLDSDIDE